MKPLVLFALLLFSGAARDAGASVEVPAPGGPVQVVSPASNGGGVMPAGPLFGPLTLEDHQGPVSVVPEPVWASVLAACALSILRRVRH